MKNILFSTTRQWNPGDEFIMHGVKRLFNAVFGAENINYIIYNRHPSITPRRSFLKRRWSKPELRAHLDNSFILDDDQLIDYVVFAGTPEWYGGKRMDQLHEYILKNKTRCAFIGVGVPKKPFFSETLKSILNHQTDLFIARDPDCYESVKTFPNTHYRSCPALFSAAENKKRESLKKICISVQDVKVKDHKIPDELANDLLNQFSNVEKEFPHVEYIANYIDDLKYGVKLGKKVIYSAYSEDYQHLMDKFDLVISTRVHTCGMAASLGIPNVLIPHDGRYKTGFGFKSIMYDGKSDLVDLIKGINISEFSEQLIQLREEQLEEYMKLIKGSIKL